MSRQLAYRASLIALVSAAAVAGASSAAPARDSADVVSGDLTPYTTPRTAS